MTGILWAGVENPWESQKVAGCALQPLHALTEKLWAFECLHEGSADQHWLVICDGWVFELGSLDKAHWPTVWLVPDTSLWCALWGYASTSTHTKAVRGQLSTGSYLHHFPNSCPAADARWKNITRSANMVSVTSWFSLPVPFLWVLFWNWLWTGSASHSVGWGGMDYICRLGLSGWVEQRNHSRPSFGRLQLQKSVALIPRNVAGSGHLGSHTKAGGPGNMADRSMALASSMRSVLVFGGS